MEIIGLILLGFFVSIVGTIIGIGGGIVFVPVFIYLFPHWTPMEYVGTSLFTVMCNAISGATAYVRQGKVLVKTGLLFVCCAIPGSILGAQASNYFSGPGFRLAFGLFLFCVSILVFMRNRKKSEAQLGAHVEKKDIHVNHWLGVVISFAVGFLSAIFGIGGGLVQVPSFIYLMGVPTYYATATSQFILAFSSIAGTSVHVLEHHVIFRVAIFCSIGAFLGAQVGAKIAQHLRAKVILTILVTMMFVLSLRMIYSSHIFG